MFQLQAKTTVSLDILGITAAMDLRPALDDAGNRKVTELVRSLGTGGGDPQAGAPPVSRHGGRGLAGRFTYELLDNGQTLRYGNTSVYAMKLFYGGDIFPVNAKALTIPIKGSRAVGKRAKDFPGLFRLPNTNLLVVAKQKGRGKGKTTELELLFSLQPKVTLNPHPYPIEWTQADNDALAAYLRKQLAQAKGGQP